MQLFKFKSQETIRKFSLRQQLTYVSHIWEYPSWHQEIYKNGSLSINYISIPFFVDFCCEEGMPCYFYNNAIIKKNDAQLFS